MMNKKKKTMPLELSTRGDDLQTQKETENEKKKRIGKKKRKSL